MSKKKYIKSLSILSIILLFIGGYCINYFNKKYLYNNTIASNISIDGIDISNKTKEEASKRQVVSSEGRQCDTRRRMKRSTLCGKALSVFTGCFPEQQCPRLFV